MIVIDPLTVDDAAFDNAASDVPENDNPLFVLGTSYVPGNKVMETANVHKNFECLIANNDQTPSDATVNGGGDPFWLDLGATNRWAMFDEIIENQTTNASTITFNVTPGQIINSIGLLNISGATAQIVGDEPIDGEFYNETFELISTENVFDGYSYCFAPFDLVPDIVAINIPPYLNADFTITISGSGTVELGEFVYGAAFDLGTSLEGAQPGLESFSIIGENLFGQNTIIPRANRKLMTIDTAVNTGRIANISRQMATLLDKPSLWVGADEYSDLIVYGILGAYTPGYGTKGSISFINYEIKGFI